MNESYALLPFLFGVAGYTEVRFRRIPNFATLTALVLAIAASFIFRGWEGGRSSLIGAAVGGGVLLPFCLIGALGGGDFKLMAAVGAIVGWPMIFPALYFSSLAGGVMALLLLIWKNQLLSGLTRVFKLMFGRKDKSERKGLKRDLTLPFGLAIAVGTLIAIVRNWQ